jgi:hypothetical protein
MKKYLVILFVLSHIFISYAQDAATSKGESAVGLLGEKTRLGINFNPPFLLLEENQANENEIHQK